MTTHGPTHPGVDVDRTGLRSRFAARLGEVYGREVPAYLTLVEVSAEVNERYLAAHPEEAGRLGSLPRVTAERHGAIRVGSPSELRDAAQLFAALGMYATGFYDLRDARPQPIPVVSTAFRPQHPDELARNPFRVFCSMLVPQDRRFFDEDLERRLVEFVDARTLFGDDLLDLARQAEARDGLSEGDAAHFLDLAAAALELSADPVDRQWYDELAAISGVAADIGGVTTTHINHLTPRVLDIDDLYDSMQRRGIEMIAQIQGPPRWEGPDVLLRQTSFRALAERRVFREPDGTIADGELRVRFGEVEQRGIALTPAGRDLYDELVAETDRRLADAQAEATTDTTSGAPRRQDIAAAVWAERMPRTEDDLIARDLAYFTFAPTPQGTDRVRAGETAPSELATLLADGWATAEPIVYEDFLPRSAAGIFASNLTDQGRRDATREEADRNLEWLSEAIGRPVTRPEDLYEEQRRASLVRTAAALGLTAITGAATAGSGDPATSGAPSHRETVSTDQEVRS